MDTVLRATAVYLFVWLIFRIAGKRSLAQITTFDAVLLLIISETTQAGLIDDDNSITNSIVLIMTILGLDVVMSCLKQRFPRVEHVMDGIPLLIYDRGEMREHAMTKERVDRDDLLHAARALRGLANMDDVKYAILEPTGDITIVPKRS